MLLAKGWPRRETWIAYNRGDLHMERSSFREAGYGGPSGLFVKICAKGKCPPCKRPGQDDHLEGIYKSRHLKLREV